MLPKTKWSNCCLNGFEIGLAKKVISEVGEDFSYGTKLRHPAYVASTLKHQVKYLVKGS